MLDTHERAFGADVGAAWAEVEAALPADGSYLIGVFRIEATLEDDGSIFGPQWQAHVGPRIEGASFRSGVGQTPADALRSLATELRSAIAPEESPSG